MRLKIGLYSSITWGIYVFYLFTIIAFGDRTEYYRISNFTFLILIGLMLISILGNELLLPKQLTIFVPFLIFSFVSCLWSYDFDATLVRSVTILKVMVLMIIMSFYLYKTKQIEMYLMGISVAGFFVVLYVIAFYGIGGLVEMMSDSVRVGDDFVNSNSLAMYLALAAIILLQRFLNVKKNWYTLLPVILFTIIIALTGSKKGIIDLVLGTTIVMFFGRQDIKNNKIARYALGVVILCVILFLVLELPVFALVKARMELMIGEITGTGTKIDYSTVERQKMLLVGLEQFKKTPILGIGIGASGKLTASIVGFETYLHNNFVELLATGGIIGTLIYYIPFIKTLGKAWECRITTKYSMSVFAIGAIWLLNDIAAVHYFSKMTYIILAIILANNKLNSCVNMNGD